MNIEESVSPAFIRTILDPDNCREYVPTLNEAVWVYRYDDPKAGHRLCIGTHIDPFFDPHAGEIRLSLGGFRIVPRERAALAGFAPEREAIELSVGMEEKVFWSKLCRVAGPLGIKSLDKIVGGKCVLLVNGAARIGEAGDYAALTFAVACLKDFEEHSGIGIVTGQDLGHGMMSDGKCTSLQFLNKNFHGSVLADTSKPTGEGNFYMLKGMLAAFGQDLGAARVGLIGVGNVGEHVLARLKEAKVEVRALEAVEAKRNKLKDAGVIVYAPDQKAEFLKEPFSALVVNANGGSLNLETIKLILANSQIKVICGCENLVMPDPKGEELLLSGGRVYCHTELCGMMGYLTAVEEYLTKRAGTTYTLEGMYEASKPLEAVGKRAADEVIKGKFSEPFTRVVKRIFRTA